MTSYLTPQGLQILQGFESSGNPTATNPASTASGLYGFINNTWQLYAPTAGIDISQYPTAASAPASVQTQVAAITPISNWTCPGCDVGFTNALNANPALASSTPTTDFSTVTGGGNSSLSFADPTLTGPGGSTGSNPLTSIVPSGGDYTGVLYDALGNPLSTSTFPGGSTLNTLMFGDPLGFGMVGSGTGILGNLTGGAVSATSPGTGSTSPLSAILDSVTNIFERGAFVFLGIVVIAIGIWALVRHTDTYKAAKRGATRVAMAAA